MGRAETIFKPNKATSYIFYESNLLLNKCIEMLFLTSEIRTFQDCVATLGLTNICRIDTNWEVKTFEILKNID